MQAYSMPKQHYTQACAETFCWLASTVPTKSTDNFAKNASDSLCVLLVSLFLDFLWKPDNRFNSYVSVWQLMLISRLIWLGAKMLGAQEL